MTAGLPVDPLASAGSVAEDLSVGPPLGTPKSYLTLSAGPEQVLAHRGSAEPRTEPCVCGGAIVIWPGESIAAAVRVHQVTLLHETWRWKAGITESELRALWGDR